MDIQSVSSIESSTAQQTYVPLRALGKGAFGEAWLYRKAEDNSLVVWKEINLGKLNSKAQFDAHNEIQVLAMLDHANIVAYYNHFLDNNLLLIEMEYCNNGSLYHRLGQETELLEEKQVVWYLFQCCSALQHIHDLGILHRDIKTLNIFCTKADLLKLGDFGIAKALENDEYAETFVGTPYYMSPELVQGNKYNLKSDIWAMGCVLYEMLSLRRTFDASNPLKLANEIVHGHIEPIHSQYSEHMHRVYRSMLNQDPATRPDADRLLEDAIFEQAPWSLESLRLRVVELNYLSIASRPMSGGGRNTSTKIVKSQTLETYYWGNGKSLPIKVDQLENYYSALQVAIGPGHLAAVTIEKELLTWAAPNSGKLHGQLGHSGNISCRTPRRVEALKSCAIKQVACGEDFTLANTESGELFAFGSNYYGCLGQEDFDEEESHAPLLVSLFNGSNESFKVAKIACGDAHVVVLTRSKDIYSWGCGELGRLGLATEDDHNSPQLVPLKKQNCDVTAIFAGPDCSFLVTDAGKVLACGSNEHNKLGLNSALSGLRKTATITYDVPYETSFRLVQPLSQYHVQFISSGTRHSAALDCFGQLLMFGCNKYGQLGLGDCRRRTGVHCVAKISRQLIGKYFLQVACGNDFTVAATSDNEVFSWGRSDNGQLGRGPSASGVQDSVQASPKPIFGALHAVTDIAARAGHSIMIAEMVNDVRVLRENSVTSSKESPNKDMELYINDHKPELSTLLNESTDSVCYTWLKNELDDAQIIHLNEAANEVIPVKKSLPDSDRDSIMCTCSCSQQLLILKQQVVSLKAENAELKYMVEQLQLS